LLIDASGFNGWEDIAAFGNHAGFVKNHQQKVDLHRSYRRARLAALVDCRSLTAIDGNMPDRSMRYTKLEFRDRQHSPRLGLLIG
jgi:hypothetical protein